MGDNKIIVNFNSSVSNLKKNNVNINDSELTNVIHLENSFFESKKHFFDIRLKKKFLFELKKVLLIQKHFILCKKIYFFGS